MHRWMARAAGGTSQRLKPGPAIVRPLSRIPTPGAPGMPGSRTVDMESPLRGRFLEPAYRRAEHTSELIGVLKGLPYETTVLADTYPTSAADLTCAHTGASGARPSASTERVVTRASSSGGPQASCTSACEG